MNYNKKKRNIRIRHEWGGPPPKKFTGHFTSEQLAMLHHLQELLREKNLNVSLAVLLRAGVLSLLESIESELQDSPESGLAVVVRVLEKAAEKDYPFELQPQSKEHVPFWRDRLKAGASSTLH